MAASNYDDVLNQLRDAGFTGRGIDDGLRVGTARPVRCRLVDDREKRGWYRLTEWQTRDGDLLIVGSFGVWHGDDNGARKIELRKTEFNREERDALRKRLAENKRRADAELRAQHERAGQRAASAWSRYAATGESEYLTRKGVRALGIRFTPSGAAVIPLMDAAGVVHGLQVVRTSAQAKERHKPEKEFWPPGLAKKGHFHLIGMPTWIVLIAEGYATAASLHDATQLPVAAAFDANNMGPVAAALRKRYPAAKILLCADDDILAKCHARIDDGNGGQRTCNARLILPDHPEICPSCGQQHRATNTGVDAAAAAALEVGGAWMRPQFADEAARRALFLDRGIKHTDFNDLAQSETTNAVRVQVESRLSELAWHPRANAAPVIQSGGAGRDALRPIASSTELLQRYALVYAQKKTVFDRQEHCLLPLGDMRDACISKGIYNAWYEHPARSIVRVREVGFDPGGDDPEVTCNLWSGWPTEPKEGSCAKLLALLWHLCSGEKNAESPNQLYQWVLNWLAYPIQHPGAKLKTTLVMHGPQGTGKNLLFEAIMAIYGEFGAVIDQTAIEDKFNDWASRKLFLIADEVIARSDIYHVKNKLKAFITGEWIRINPKQVAAYNERNHVNMVFLSNEAMPVALEEDDRRHVVIWTPDKLAPEFYQAVLKEIADGGIAALHHHLLQHDTGDFGPGTLPPYTEAKRQLVDLGMDSPSRFFHDYTAGEIPHFEKDHITHALSRDVFDLYRMWCNRLGDKRIAPLPKFVNALERKHKVVQVRKRYRVGWDLVGPHGILMLGPEQCPPGADEGEFLGDQITAFRGHLRQFKEAEHA
jgi:putative DNA primase/helicase